MSALDVVAALLFVAPVPGWAVTLILVAAARQRPRIGALTERAAGSVVLSIAATLVAILGGARLGRVPIDRDVFLGVIVAVFALVSVPQFIWLQRFLSGGFGRADE